MSKDLRVVNDARQLLEIAELTDIVFYEVHGRRSPDAADSEPSVRIALKREAQTIEVRCRAYVASLGGAYSTDASAVFSLDEDVSISDEAMTEFVEKVGVMTVYPYLREAISQAAAKLGLERPILKLLRPGEVRVTPNEQQDADHLEE